MARSLLHQMTLKYLVYSGLAEEYQLKIKFYKECIEIRSPLWNEHLVLCFYKNRSYWCFNMPFEKEGEVVDYIFDIDSVVRRDEQGYYCKLCLEREYFNSVEELIYDELFKFIIQDLKKKEYEKEVKYGDGWAYFINDKK